MRFYDRTSELRELERIYELSKNTSHFTVIVGRRRVGKTRLVEEFIKNKPYIYFFVSRKSSAMLIEEFSRIMRDFYGNSPMFYRWEDLFEYLFTHGERLIVVIDEFQNFQYSSPEVFSILQKVYDKYKEEGKTMLIVMGSYISMMKRIFQDSREPLFGRATESMGLRPLSPSTAISIAMDMGFSAEESITLHSIFGGLPKYYVMLEEQGLKGKSVSEVLKRSFFTEFSLLRDEVKSTLVEDFGPNYSTYFSILEAISQGYMTFTAISDKTGIKRDSLSKYLHVLRDDFSLISTKMPISREKSTKRTRYVISDNLVDFWFRFVFSQSSLIEIGNYGEALSNTMEGIPMFVASKFEDLVREAIRKELGYTFVGSWWSRKGEEIDIVAIDKKKGEALFGEVKWRNRKTGCGELTELEKKSELTGIKGIKKRYLLVSKSGFTENCLKEMEEKGTLHLDLEDVVKILLSKTD